MKKILFKIFNYKFAHPIWAVISIVVFYELICSAWPIFHNESNYLGTFIIFGSLLGTSFICLEYNFKYYDDARWFKIVQFIMMGLIFFIAILTNFIINIPLDKDTIDNSLVRDSIIFLAFFASKEFLSYIIESIQVLKKSH
ncbi:hypothetical protein ACI2LD_05345 [Enterococcus casseliflavus]|uniref:hypothetical protein n=1 Tax=Enterococcus casseliflavus TaxID=37734 RepID=UPI0037A8464F